MKIRHLSSILLLLSLINNTFSQVIDYSTNIYIEDGKMLIRRSYTINVSGSDYREAGEISIRHSSHADFKLLNAGIIDKNGEVVRTIKKKDLHEVSMRSRRAFFDDDKVVRFNLQWHEYPYQVTYSHEEKFSEFLTIANWFPVVYENMTTLQSSLELHVPLDYKFNYYYSPELTFTEDTLPGRVRKLAWNNWLFKLPDTEKYAPPLEESIPNVLIVPDKFNYHKAGCTSTWSDFGKWISDLNSQTGTLPVSEQKIVDSLITTCANKTDKIRVLYHYLQDNTSYVNVSIGYGGLKSFPASYVCKNKYGDCKALTTYIKAMLEHVGIDSYYAVINTGNNAMPIRESIPAQQFNHVILCVPLETDTIWLENTSGSLPFNYISSSNQSRMALLVKSSDSRLIKTPSFSENDVEEIRTYNYHLDENGKGTLAIEGKLKGYSFERFSYIKSKWDDKDKKEAIADYFNEEDLNMDAWAIEKVDRDAHFITLTANGHVDEKVKNIGEFKVIQPMPVDIPDLKKPDNRNQPVRFNYPVNKSDSISYYLPHIKSYSCQLPENFSLCNKYGKFTLEFAKSDNIITVTRQLIIFEGDYPLEVYPDFYEFIQKLHQIQKKSAIILTQLKP